MNARRHTSLTAIRLSLAAACAAVALVSGWGGVSPVSRAAAADPHVVVDGGICSDFVSDTGLLPGYTKYDHPWTWLRSFDSFVAVGISDSANPTVTYRYTDEAGQACYRGTNPYPGSGVYQVLVQQYIVVDPDDTSTWVPLGSPIGLTVHVGIATLSAPDAPVLADDSGVPGDGVTNVAAPGYDGVAHVDAIVPFVDGSPLPRVTPDPVTGAYAFTLPAEADGPHAVGVEAMDVFGNTSPVTAVPLTIDTVAPVTSVLSLDPASDSGVAGDRATNAATITLHGTSEPGASVTLEGSTGGPATAVATGTADGTGEWTLAFAPGEGTWQLRGRATDVAGNAGALGDPLQVVVDRTGNVPTLELDPASDSGTPGDGYTNDLTPTFRGAAVAGDSIALYAAEGSSARVAIGSATVAADGTWTITSPELLAVADYTFTADETDYVGNVLTSLPLALGTRSTEPGAIGVAILPADDGGMQGDWLTNVAAPRVDVNLPGFVAATASIDGGAAAPLTVDASTHHALWQLTALPDGEHELSVTAQDAYGNQRTIVQWIVIDTTRPAGPDVYLLDSLDPAVSATATVRIGGHADPTASTVLVWLDGATDPLTADVAGGLWSIVTGPLPEGTHSVTARAEDAAGNISDPVSLTFAVDLPEPEPSASPTASARVTPPTTAAAAPRDGDGGGLGLGYPIAVLLFMAIAVAGAARRWKAAAGR